MTTTSSTHQTSAGTPDPIASADAPAVGGSAVLAAPATEPAEQGAPDDAAIAHAVQILNDGAIALLVTVGHRLRLFDLLATLPPSTSVQIADAAGLHERYVREWLGGVTTAGFVRYAPSDASYQLRREYVPLLAGHGPDNIARNIQLIATMGEVAPKVIEVFRSGGGLSYEDYPHFHEMQAEDSTAVHDAALIPVILPLTGELDRLRSGIDVVDFACGQGHAVNLMAREYPRSRFTGIDLSDEAIAAARAEARSWGLQNAGFEVRDVAEPPEASAYDLITVFDAIHDQAHPATVLANARAALRPGGTFLMVELAASSYLENNLELPWASFLYAASTFHCMSVSLGQGGDGLGTVWGGELAEQALRDAGFSDVVVHALDDDPFNTYFVAHP